METETPKVPVMSWKKLIKLKSDWTSTSSGSMNRWIYRIEEHGHSWKSPTHARQGRGCRRDEIRVSVYRTTRGRHVYRLSSLVGSSDATPGGATATFSHRPRCDGNSVSFTRCHRLSHRLPRPFISLVLQGEPVK